MTVDREGRKAGLAFTEILSPEECDILMYRDDVADLYLEPSEVNEGYIANAKIFARIRHGACEKPVARSRLKSGAYRKKHDVKVVFELDYRPYTWQSAEETAVYYTLVAEQSDIVIGTRDEFDVMENRAAEITMKPSAICLRTPLTLSSLSTALTDHTHTADREKFSGRMPIKQRC